MADDDPEEPPSLLGNVITDQTGRLDVRFTLWRRFCAETGVAVDALPSELSGEEKAAWERMKEAELSSPHQE